MTAFSDADGPSQESQKALLDLVALWSVLQDDVKRAEAALAQHDSQYARRQVVRTSVAKSEGLTSALKQIAAHTATDEFSTAERALLAEEAFVLDEKGVPKTSQQFLKLATNIQFAFRAYAKVCRVRFAIPTSKSEWRDFLASIKVRNRITHPRAVHDLSVTKDEVSAATRATSWLDQQWFALQELTIERIAYESGMSAVEMRSFRALRKQLVSDMTRRQRGSNDPTAS
jgi:hypothetical protein